MNIMIFQIVPPRAILLSPKNIIGIFLFGFANCVFAGQGIINVEDADAGVIIILMINSMMIYLSRYLLYIRSNQVFQFF